MFRILSLVAAGSAFLAASLSTGVAWGQGLPGMAVGIVGQSTLAEQAALGHNQAAALDHIRLGTILAEQILKASPPELQPVFVQIYQSTDTSTTYSPVKGKPGGEFTPNRLKKHTSVRDVESTITTTRLNVTASLAHLQAAQSAVESGNWVIADSELAAIPNSVTRTSVQGNMPLLEAQQNLQLARMRVAEHKFKDAKAPLLAAAQDLGNFERLAPPDIAAHAEYFREQIHDYAHTIAHRHSDAASRIGLYLGYVNKWYAEEQG